MDMPFQGLFTTLIPKLLKPIFGPLMCRQARRDTNKGIAACLPLIKARLDDHHRRNKYESSKEKQPVSFLNTSILALSIH
jgi:hypothetical protein